MSVILLALILFVLAVGGFGVALLLRGLSRYGKQADLAPGLSTDAPSEWAGQHTPEAKLHRRLGTAVTALSDLAGDPNEDIRLLELRVELEQEAIEVDHRLMAAAALPPFIRTSALEAMERAVAAVEQGSADLITQVKGRSLGTDSARLEELTSTIRSVAEARAELDALDDPSNVPGLDQAAPPAAASPEVSRPEVNRPEDIAPEDETGPGTPQAGTG